MDMEEMKTGLLDEVIDDRDALASDYIGVEPEDDIPDYFELPAPSPCHNQIHPSCVAELESRISEYANAKEGESQKQSSRFVYAHCKAIDGYSGMGTFLSSAVSVATNVGVSKEVDYPSVTDYYEYIKKPSSAIDDKAGSYRIGGYVRFTNSTEEKLIKKYILKYLLPIRTGSSGSNASWTASAVANNNNVIPEYTSKEWNHAIAIVGWWNGGWIIENSWGNDWGREGRATLPYSYIGLFNYSYGGYDLPNYWRKMDNQWKQHDVITAYWDILKAIGHPEVNEKDYNTHMNATTPQEMTSGFVSVFEQLREHVGDDVMNSFMEKMGWK